MTHLEKTDEGLSIANMSILTIGLFDASSPIVISDSIALEMSLVMS